jgi:alpha-glucosidase
MIKTIPIAFVLVLCCAFAKAQNFILRSPNQKLEVHLSAGAILTYSLSYQGKPYLLPSAIEMSLQNGKTLGEQVKIIHEQRNTTDQILHPAYGISKNIRENYNELTLQCQGNYRVVFRAYNEGFAYRFQTQFKDSIKVLSERSEFRFNGNYKAYFHPTLSESEYRVQHLNDKFEPNYSSTPLLLQTTDQLNILVHESDVSDYPCMSLSADANNPNLLLGNHAAYPKKVIPSGNQNFNLKVLETENYIAKTTGNRSFPWRLVAFEQEDKNILTNQLVYLLAKPSVLKDESWIKPGKVAWDWWNALNLTGVHFKSGVNTDTYKYYIDFAARNHLEYIILDEGWSDPHDVLKVDDKQLNMAQLSQYAKSKNVGLILWCVWHDLDREMMPAFDEFVKWGIAGLKVDFMDRDDQVVVNFQERLVKEAAQRHMLIDFHGAYHPNGMPRTYPNLINVEGVKGMEWDKFDAGGTPPGHDVSIPFIRMFAGGMDYTPGAMQNYNKAEWKMNMDRPMSQGTRCHQLAMYPVYYAPLQMLSDAPTAYEKEPAVLKFISAMPTTWDESVALDGRVGEYVAIARRKAANWYIGAMASWQPKTLSFKMDFLEQGKTYTAEIFKDGQNAERIGNDYERIVEQVKKGDIITVQMAAGGGWAAICTLNN